MNQEVAHMRLPTKRAPTHPGEMLLEEFIKPLGLTQKEVASRLGVSFVRLNEIVNGRRGITPDTALRLARLFETTPEFWLNGQLAWDLWHVMQAPAAAEIRRIRPVKKTEAA
jgi:addiction module HigA family antidote